MEEKVCQVEIQRVRSNPCQPRRQFNPEELQELAASIKAIGIIHPPVVRALPRGEYELLAGERRLRASELAGLKTISVIVRDYTCAVRAEAALIENIQRVDLNPIEIAQALKEMAESLQLTQEALAVKVGKKRSTVANYFRLLTLPQVIQDGLTAMRITMGHAKAILALEDESQQLKLFAKILNKRLTVRQTEGAASQNSMKSRNLFLEEVSKRLEEKLGTKVTIAGKGQRGSIRIDYYSLDDLERVLSLF